MDTFVDSSWYFYRYTDANNDQAPFDGEKAGYWFGDLASISTSAASSTPSCT